MLPVLRGLFMLSNGLFSQSKGKGQTEHLEESISPSPRLYKIRKPTHRNGLLVCCQSSLDHKPDQKSFTYNAYIK